MTLCIVASSLLFISTVARVTYTPSAPNPRCLQAPVVPSMMWSDLHTMLTSLYLLLACSVIWPITLTHWHILACHNLYTACIAVFSLSYAVIWPPPPRHHPSTASMVHSMAWNDLHNMLAALVDGNFSVWMYPNAAYVDKDLLAKTVYSREAGLVFLVDLGTL